jgi:hypothetical protein
VNISGGDWGTGRVALNPIHLRQGPFGDTRARSGFYLHGGFMAGSSGCIDIGGHFTELADWFGDDRRMVRVTVRYRHPAPCVDVFTGLSGLLAYQHAAPGISPWLSLGPEFAGDTPRLRASLGADAVLRWAGGALSAGVRLDVPMNDREQFIRLGLQGGLRFRIFQSLFGELHGGFMWSLAGSSPRGAGAGESGSTTGGGVTYDFGRVQLGAVYDHLWSLRGHPDVNAALLRLGMVFP